MKSEHRHDLETNWLAHHIAGWIEQLKPHSTKLLILAAIVASLLLVVSISSSVNALKNKDAWEAYALALNTTDPEFMQLQRVAEEYPGTTMQEWAYATWADRHLLIASSRYLVDRDAAKDRLRSVQGIYESIIHAGDPQVRARAHLGLARIYEMLDQLDKARSEYTLVEGDLAPLARERSSQLESSEVQQACQWLATAELPRPAPLNDSGLPGTSPGQPGSRPPFAAIPPEATGAAQSMKSIEELLGGPMPPMSTGGPTGTGNQDSAQADPQTTENRYNQQAGTSENTAAEAGGAAAQSPAVGTSESPRDPASDTPAENLPEEPAQADPETAADQASKTEP
jgi:hypothetical protein